MTVNDEDNEDFRAEPRWSAGKKLDVVLGVLRGESLDQLSRELGVVAIASRRGATTFWPPARRREEPASDERRRPATT